MPELIAKSALAGRAPLTLLDTTLAEGTLGALTSIACFPGSLTKVKKALKGWPEPNRFLDAPLRIWTGPDQIFLAGDPAPDLAGLAAVTDQTGGWAVLTLDGPAAVDTLIRLYPLDFALTAMPVGSALRSPLGHMQSVLIRRGESAFTLLVFRSMARTAWAELEEALQKLAARKAAS